MKIYSIFKNVIGSLLNILFVNDSEPQGKLWLIPMQAPLYRKEKKSAHRSWNARKLNIHEICVGLRAVMAWMKSCLCVCVYCMGMLYLYWSSLGFFFFLKVNRKDLKVKVEDCIGQHQLSHPGPPIGRLINKVLSHKRERCRMLEHNTFAMVIDPLLYVWVSVYSFQCRLIFFNLTPCSSLLLLIWTYLFQGC